MSGEMAMASAAEAAAVSLSEFPDERLCDLEAVFSISAGDVASIRGGEIVEAMMAVLKVEPFPINKAD